MSPLEATLARLLGALAVPHGVLALALADDVDLHRCWAVRPHGVDSTRENALPDELA